MWPCPLTDYLYQLHLYALHILRPMWLFDVLYVNQWCTCNMTVYVLLWCLYYCFVCIIKALGTIALCSSIVMVIYHMWHTHTQTHTHIHACIHCDSVLQHSRIPCSLGKQARCMCVYLYSCVLLVQVAMMSQLLFVSTFTWEGSTFCVACINMLFSSSIHLHAHSHTLIHTHTCTYLQYAHIYDTPDSRAI